MRTIYLLILLFLSLQSCARNYVKEIEKLSAEYEKQGKVVLATSMQKHFIIYQDGDAFWLNNLDEPARKILSADKKMVKVYYHLSFNDKGHPGVRKSFDEIKLDEGFFRASNISQDEMGYVYPYKKEEIKLLNDEAISFVYQTLDDYRGVPYKNESKLVYYFSNSDTLYYSYTPPTVSPDGSRIDRVGLNLGYIAGEINDDEYSFSMGEGGAFYWTINLDAKGKVIGTNENLVYENEHYDKHILFNRSSFSTLGRTKSVLKLINDTLTACAQRQAEKEMKIQIEKLVKESISIEQLSSEYSNTLKANRDYKGKTFTVSCELESLEEAGGLFEPDGYKYKVVSHALVAFGEWMSGYDILGYTNDDNFVELSFPRKVVMEVTLQSGSSSRFEFRDCKLLAW